MKMRGKKTSHENGAPHRWPGAAALLSAIIFSSFTMQASADSLRCGRKVVRTGDSSKILLKHCGEPLSKSSGQEFVRISGGVKEVRVKQWHYKKSTRSLEQVIWVYQGRVVAIKSGGR